MTKVMSGLVIVRYNSRPTKHGRYGVASSSKSPVIACSKIRGFMGVGFWFIINKTKFSKQMQGVLSAITKYQN